MKRLFRAAAVASLMAASGYASTLYVLTSNGTAYSVSSSGGAATAIATQAGLTTLADVNGELYGLTNAGALYDVAYTGGSFTSVATGLATGITALTEDSAGNLWAVSGTTLYEYSTSGTQLFTHALTGISGTAGDLDFYGGVLYLSAGTTATLYSVNTTTGAAASAGTITPTQTTVGMAHGAGLLYGFNTTQVFTLTTTGGTAGAANITGLGGGNNIIDAADAIPEPATFGFIGLGLVALGGLAHRRRKP